MTVDWLPGAEESFSRFVLQRGVAAVYLIAFLAARNQFRGLLGSRGLTPIPRFVARVSFRRAPSIFQLHYTDRFFAGVCWLGMLCAGVLVAGGADRAPIPVVMALWALLWTSYVSIVNVGQIWYGFGWESLLCEAGFLAVFLGPTDMATPVPILVLFWWLLFRLEFGAGLIKLRGDPCWRDLSCLDHHHQTQPMPGPFSWWFHHLPRPLHRIEVGANHLAQVVLPLALLGPQPVRTVAAAAIIVTQVWLMLSGNFAWLNLLTVVIALSALDGGLVEGLTGLTTTASVGDRPMWFDVVVGVVVALVVVLSWRPARNLVSRRQRMNASFDPLHLVNTYGAFGSVSRRRDELVIEATTDEPGAEAVWREYGFKGKPGDPSRRPRQWAPYHLRLDWMLWFVPLDPGYGATWLDPLVARLLDADPDILALLSHDPFAGERPAAVRIRRFRYRFTSWRERRDTGDWWVREFLGDVVTPVRRRRRPTSDDQEER